MFATRSKDAQVKPRLTITLAGIGAASVIYLAGTLVLMHVIQPGLNPAKHYVSEYALGQAGGHADLRGQRTDIGFDDPGRNAGDVRRAFVDANPGWKAGDVALEVNRRGWLEGIRLCYRLDYRPRPCRSSQLGPADGTKVSIYRGL